MSSLIDNATIKKRRDTASNWTSNNPTPNDGETCLETDTGFIKIGDGSTAWTSLDYQPNPAEVDAKWIEVPKIVCKAWVNFDGTTNTAGFCDIRDSYNVASVADNGAGDYTINFTTNMNDANYSTVITASLAASGNQGSTIQNGTVAVGSVSIYPSRSAAGVNVDSNTVCVQIFGS